LGREFYLQWPNPAVTQFSDQAMTTASDLRSGKTHKDENFPVASRIIHPRHRGIILAYYNFVRTADDISDHAELDDATKLRLLDELEHDLIGRGGGQPEALALREAFAARGMSPRHACDVVTAFRMDVTKRRYNNWNELIHYCSYSAMPVGRFMLDVHGESQGTWAASDALCAALQIINHLQDCAKDYRNLDRVYLPADAMAETGATIDMIGEPRSPAPLLTCLHRLADRSETLLLDSEALAPLVVDARLACEIGVIQAYARRILGYLKQRDPLCERVHLTKLELAGLGLGALATGIWRRATTSASPSKPASGA
jgi:squalene synthase HpnC